MTRRLKLRFHTIQQTPMQDRCSTHRVQLRWAFLNGCEWAHSRAFAMAEEVQGITLPPGVAGCVASATRLCEAESARMQLRARFLTPKGGHGRTG